MGKYSPSEVCIMFEISKSTLFRWEQEGKISPVPRKISGERIYSDVHLFELATIVKETLHREYKIALQRDDMSRLSQIMEALSTIKAIYLNDVSGVRELGELNHLSDEITRELLLKAASVNLQDRLFREIIEVVYKKMIKQS